MNDLFNKQQRLVNKTVQELRSEASEIFASSKMELKCFISSKLWAGIKKKNLRLLSGQIQTESSKVPRPANAFMLFANENRKKMAHMYPLDSNKEISKRLGNSWRSLEAEEKNKYFAMAKQVDADHKKKYPG